MEKKGLVEDLKYKYYLLCDIDKIDMPKYLSEEELKEWRKELEKEKQELEKKSYLKQVQKIGNKIRNLKRKYYLLCNPDEIDMPKFLSEEEQKEWLEQLKEEKTKQESKKGAKPIQKIGSKIEKIKYTYRLIMKPAAIKMPKGLSIEEQEEWVRNQYNKKAKIHKKFGAEKFQKFVLSFDKVKFKVLNRKLIKKIYIKLSDKIIQYNTDKYLCKGKPITEEQLDYEWRSKTLVRVELNERKSLNYHIGVNRRKEQFPLALEMNKRIHKDSIKRNGKIFGVCVGLGLLGMPILPQLIGGYQILAAFKNMQCINIQEYNLSRMKAEERRIATINMREINRIGKNNQDLISELSKAKKRGESVATLESIVAGLNTKESLEQMRALILHQKRRLEKNNQQQKQTENKDNNSLATKQDTFNSQANQIINNATSISALQSMKNAVLQTAEGQIPNSISIGNIKK